MKKFISICLLLVLMMSTLVCVHADQPKVVFTSGSRFEVGGAATVDMSKTAETVLSDGSATSDMYNAALERNMDVMWRCSNGPDKYGKSVTWTADDAGKEYVCRVGFYSDAACTEFVDYVDSQPFTVSGGSAPQKVEITPTGPFYLTVGKSFKQQLSCNLQGVTFENFRTSFPNGIDISSNGLISGTPTKEGFWYVTIVAYKNGEQIGDIGVEFYVNEGVANDPPEITTKYLPDATVGQDYYVKLQCTDPDATFGESYNPGKPNEFQKTGLILTQHGELEGRPTKAGTYTFCICASGEAGEGYMVYTLKINEAEEETTAPTEAETEPTEATTEPVDVGEATEPTDVVETNEATEPTEGNTLPVDAGSNQVSKKTTKSLWIIVGIVVAVLLVLAVIAVVIVVLIIIIAALKKKKNKKES